jgi:hypothetical protein
LLVVLLVDLLDLLGFERLERDGFVDSDDIAGERRVGRGEGEEGHKYLSELVGVAPSCTDRGLPAYCSWYTVTT